MMDSSILAGLLRSTTYDDAKTILYSDNEIGGIETRFSLLWQAYQMSGGDESGTLGEITDKSHTLALLLIHELLTHRKTDYLWIQNFLASIISQDTGLELFNLTFAYAALRSRSAEIRAVLSWGLCTLPPEAHKALWCTVIEHVPQICQAKVCPLLLVWYWLLHCYEYSATLGATFLETLHTLAELRYISGAEYHLLRALTYLAVLSGKQFPTNRHISVVNIRKEALFPSDGVFIECITNVEMLDTLQSYHNGIELCIEYLVGATYCHESMLLSVLLPCNQSRSKSNNDHSNNIPLEKAKHDPLLLSLLAFIRSILQLHLFKDSPQVTEGLQSSIQQAVFHPDHIKTVLTILNRRGITLRCSDLSRAASLNNFWADPLTKARWSVLDPTVMYTTLTSTLLALVNRPMSWVSFQPWASVFIYVAGGILRVHFTAQENSVGEKTQLPKWCALLDCLGAVHSILPIASVAQVFAKASDNVSNNIGQALHVLLSQGWLAVYTRANNFVRPGTSEYEGRDERKFAVECLCNLFVQICTYSSSIEPTIQLLQSVLLPQIIRAILAQVLWIGYSKVVSDLCRLLLSRKLLTEEQWNELTLSVFTACSVTISGQKLQKAALVKQVLEIKLWVLDTFTHQVNCERNIIKCVHTMMQLHNVLHNTRGSNSAIASNSESDTELVGFLANMTKTCIARLESIDSKVDACTSIIYNAEAPIDVKYAVVDVLLGLEAQIPPSARDKISIALEMLQATGTNG